MEQIGLVGNCDLTLANKSMGIFFSIFVSHFPYWVYYHGNNIISLMHQVQRHGTSHHLNGERIENQQCQESDS